MIPEIDDSAVDGGCEGIVLQPVRRLSTPTSPEMSEYYRIRGT